MRPSLRTGGSAFSERAHGGHRAESSGYDPVRCRRNRWPPPPSGWVDDEFVILVSISSSPLPQLFHVSPCVSIG